MPAKYNQNDDVLHHKSLATSLNMNKIQEGYIGDAIELGYTIKTTGADGNIVYIEQ